MSVPTGRIKIVGAGAGPDRAITGQDIRVLLVGQGEDGNPRTLLIPALSLTLRVGSRHEKAIATIEVPAVMVDIEGVELRTEAVVESGGPESQWEEALGKRPGEAVASIEQYADKPAVVVGEPARLVIDEARFVGDGSESVDPMAELDAIIANGGRIP